MTAVDVRPATSWPDVREVMGVTGDHALITAAVRWAIEHGARVIEGYPIDTSVRKASASELFHGSLALFEDAGFRVVAAPKPNRPIVHYESRS